MDVRSYALDGCMRIVNHLAMAKPASDEDPPFTIIYVRVPPAMARMIERRLHRARKAAKVSEDPKSITRSSIARDLLAEGLAVKT